MAIGSKELAPAELDTFEDERLVDELKKAKEELFNLRFQSATGQLESHGRLRAVKRDIARIYTVIRERELGIRATPAPVEAPPRRRRSRRRRRPPRPRLEATEARPRRPSNGDARQRRPRAAAHDVQPAARGYRKTRRGYVTSDKMDKTIVVEVEDRVKHPLYGKVIRRTSKVKAHDEAEHRRHRRPRPDQRDPSPQRHQALAPRRDPREGQVGLGL